MAENDVKRILKNGNTYIDEEAEFGGCRRVWHRQGCHREERLLVAPDQLLDGVSAPHLVVQPVNGEKIEINVWESKKVTIFP